MVEWDVIGLLTYMFLHGDPLHIIGNMVVLWAFACSLETGFGKWSLLGFYLCCGIAGGLLHAAADFSSELPLIGASGACAGLIGAYTVTYGLLSKIKTLIFFFFRFWVVEIPAGAFGVLWLLMQFWSAGMDSGEGGGVAWFAHIGGFFAGVALAYVCRNETEFDLRAGQVRQSHVSGA